MKTFIISHFKSILSGIGVSVLAGLIIILIPPYLGIELISTPEFKPEIIIKDQTESKVDILIKTDNGNNIELIPANPVTIKDDLLNITYTVHEEIYYYSNYLDSSSFRFVHDLDVLFSHSHPHPFELPFDSLQDEFLKLTARGHNLDYVNIISLKYTNSTINEEIQYLISKFNKNKKVDIRTDLNDFSDLTLIINKCDKYVNWSCVHVNHIKFLKDDEKSILINYYSKQDPDSVDLTIVPEIKYLLDSIKILN